MKRRSKYRLRYHRGAVFLSTKHI